MLAIVHIGAVRRASGTTARFIRPDGNVWRGMVLRASASLGGPTSIKSNGTDSSVPLDLY
jgi:hypothetical protein